MPTEIRLIHIADVHLGADTAPLAHLGELARFVEQAVAWNPDVLVVAGDLFENNRVTQALVEKTWELFRRFPRVILLPGNHDALDTGSVYERFDFQGAHPALRVFLRPQGEVLQFPDFPVRFWGRPTVVHSPHFYPLEGAPQESSAPWEVVVAHGEYLPKGEQWMVGSPISADQVHAVHSDYVALGHRPVHGVIRQAPPVVYAGNLVTDHQTLGGCFVELGPGRRTRWRYREWDVVQRSGNEAIATG